MPDDRRARMWLRTSSPSEVLTPSHARGPPALRIRHVRLVAASGRNRPVANAVQARGGHAARRIERGRMADIRPRQQYAGQAQVVCREQGLHAEQIAAPFEVETRNQTSTGRTPAIGQAGNDASHQTADRGRFYLRSPA